MRARGQSKYQIRLGWGIAGASRVARVAHLVVWVDVLHTVDPSTVVPYLPAGPEVVLAGLGNADAVADRALALQTERGDRCIVAIVAAGIADAPVAERAVASGIPASAADVALPAPDFAVEDLLAAGAVVDALAGRGIDFTSPEAAAACAAYTGLRRGIRHLVTASESAALLDDCGRPDVVEAALTPATHLVTLRDAGERDDAPREQSRRA